MAESPLDRRLNITVFPDPYAKTSRKVRKSLRDIVGSLKTRSAPSKEALPWLKLAEFGEKRTPKGSLRHNANVIAIDGVEVDYDKEEISVDRAAELFEQAGVAALIYTSPSHRADKPRWRALLPTSGALKPEARYELCGRANSILKGAISGESFTLAQSYYYGKVGSNPDHRVVAVDGRYIDYADEIPPLDKASAPKSSPAPVANANGHDVLDEWGLGVGPVGLPENEIRDELLTIPNDDRFSERKDWLDLLFCVHHETAGSEFGRDLFHEWSVQHGSHNETLFEKAWNSAGKNYDLENPLTFRYVLKLAKAYREAADARPIIRVRSGELHTMTFEAEKALISFDAPLYTRGQRIVRPVIEEVDASKSRKTKAARLTSVPLHGLIDWMSRSAKWIRFDARSRKDVRTDPPTEVAAILASRDGEWELKPLAGVITTQTLRPDGSLLDEPGYDSQTKLLLMQPPELPAIPAKPSKRDAERALRLLDALLDEFPFTDVGSRSVALSGLISPIVRGALSVVPLHVMSAPTAGSGKSYIIDLASAIATGRACPVIAAGRNEEETEKRLGAVLMSGQTIVSIDNLNGDLDGDFLCQAVERPLVKVRILGKSEQVQIESRSTIFATGNNIIIKGDMIRRSLLCSLDPNLERPELRQFKGNPFDMILSRRGDYVAAALTVVRGYIEAGFPNKCESLASFEDWSDFVRSSLVWLGRADPLTTMESSREADPEIRIAHQIVSAWVKTIGQENPKFISEIIATGAPSFDPDHGLEEALSNLSRGGAVSAQSFGYWLRRNRNRVIGDYKICGEEDRHRKIFKWWLENIHPL
jgi:putative DNA primase/helicase